MKAHVAVYEVERPPPPSRYGAVQRPELKPPKALKPFVAEGTDHDALKLEARRWLEEKKYEVRGISWGPGVTPRDPQRLIAYVYPPRA